MDRRAAFERGVGALEIIIGGAIIAIVILGAAWGFQNSTASMNADFGTNVTRDAVNATLVDAAAISAFDQANRSKLTNAAQPVTWSVNVGGTDPQHTVQLSAQPSANGGLTLSGQNQSTMIRTSVAAVLPNAQAPPPSAAP